MFPVLEGANVTFNCPLGHVLIGSNIAECKENGEWEPDPRNIKCSGMIRLRLLARILVTSFCATIEYFTLNQTGRIAIASVIVSAFTAIIFFIFGFVFSHCCQKAQQKRIMEEPTSLQLDSLESAVVNAQLSQELELHENASYGSVH